MIGGWQIEMRKSKKKNKYESILSVSTKLISQQGFSGASLQKIADKVGLGKSSLFHYLKSKDDLLYVILKTSADKLRLNLENIVADKQLDPAEKLRRAMDNHLSIIEEYTDHANIYFDELRNLSKRKRNKYLETRKQYERILKKSYRKRKKRHCFKGWIQKLLLLVC